MIALTYLKTNRREAELAEDHGTSREYDPTTGCFTSVDPVMDMANPQQWRGYTYSHNNPTTYSDPTGLKPADMTLEDQRAWAASGGNKFASNKKRLKGYFKQIKDPTRSNPS